jgi:putative ABC transport system substrate-binding protein
MKNRIKKISMREKYIIFLLILVLFYGFAEASNDILAIQSFDVKPYEYALKGFEYVCNCNVKKIVISKSNESTILKRIDKNNPDLLLAIGMDALSKIKKIKDIPIIYLMILNPRSILSGEENITGVSMNIPPEKQLDIFHKALPEIKKIGLLFDPNNSGFFVKRAQDAAKKMDVELIIKKVDSSKKVPSLLIGMKEEIDAIWMLPDITVFSPETIEFLFIFSFESKIPVFTFSKRFLEMGALISLSFDAFDLGKQGGELAGEVLSGKRIRNLSAAEARKVIISINLKMAKKLGITMSNEILNKAEIIQ